MSKVQDKPVPLTDKEISEQDARFTIDGAIALGRIGANPPPAGHWLAEYWSIGQQLAELGKTSAWDNQTPVDANSLPAGDGLTDDQRTKVRDAIADALGNAYDCLRVWSAWGVGTMGADDFALVAEDDDRLNEITDAAIGAILAAPRQPGEVGAGVACSHDKWTWAEDGRIRCAKCGTYNKCHEDGYVPAASAQQDEREAIAWVHEDDPARAISAPQKAQMLRDGGASASSVKGYSIAAVARSTQQVQADAGAVALTDSQIDVVHDEAAEDLAASYGLHVQDARLDTRKQPTWRRAFARAILAAHLSPAGESDKRDAAGICPKCGMRNDEYCADCIPGRAAMSREQSQENGGAT